jgi:hypothetical protein
LNPDDIVESYIYLVKFKDIDYFLVNNRHSTIFMIKKNGKILLEKAEPAKTICYTDILRDLNFQPIFENEGMNI